MSKKLMTNQMIVSIIDASPVGMILVNEKLEIILSNAKVNSLFEYKEQELKGKSLSVLIPTRFHQSHKESTAKFFQQFNSRAMSDSQVLKARQKSGEEIEIKVGLSTVIIEGKNYVLATIIEVMNQILKLAIASDPLTGLHNRNLFIELSENLHHLAIRENKLITIMFIDLDGFKEINDNFGHEIGDITLCDVSRILRRKLRANDIIARYGGDEFTMCFYGLKSDFIVATLAKKILDEISSIKNINSHQVNLSASIGVFSTHSAKKYLLTEMIKKADELMYQAKNSGKSCFVIERVD